MSMLELKYPKNRLRRTRQAKWIRNLTQESMLSTNDLVWPVFVCEGSNVKDEIESMPNVYRYSIDNLSEVYDTAGFDHPVDALRYAVMGRTIEVGEKYEPETFGERETTIQSF